MKVSKLEIINSNLKYILANAFNSDVFRGTLSYLTIDNLITAASNPLAFEFITKESFNGLTLLSYLTITNIPTLKIIDRFILEPLADSLTQLSISRIANPWDLYRVLSATVLKKISTVDLQTNHITSISNASFVGIAENVKVLYLTNSKIEWIAENTFDYFKSLKTLDMRSNWLTILPVGVFDSLLEYSDFAVKLENNKWICDCDLFDTQKLILDNPRGFDGTGKCAAPEDMKQFEIIDADLCLPQDTTIPLSSQSETVGGCDGDDDDESPCSPTNEIPTGNEGY